MLSEELLHGLAPAEAFDAQQHARIGGREQCRQRVRRIFRVAVDADVGRRLVGAPAAVASLRNSTRVNGLIEPKNSSGGVKYLRRRQQGPVPIALQQTVTALRFLPERGDRVFDRAMQADDRIRRKVIGEDRGLVEKQRQVILDASPASRRCGFLVQRRFDGSPSNIRGTVAGSALAGSSNGNSRAGNRRISHRPDKWSAAFRRRTCAAFRSRCRRVRSGRAACCPSGRDRSGRRARRSRRATTCVTWLYPASVICERIAARSSSSPCFRKKVKAARYDGGGIRVSIVVAGISSTSKAPCDAACSAASRSDTRSWWGEK